MQSGCAELNQQGRIPVVPFCFWLLWHPHSQVIVVNAHPVKVTNTVRYRKDRKNFCKTLILAVDLYGCETWLFILREEHIRGCIQKFPAWAPGARTANSTALCHWVQLYRYFVSQSSEFCRHNPLCCFSTSVYCCLFRYRLSPETFGYTLVIMDDAEKSIRNSARRSDTKGAWRWVCLVRTSDGTLPTLNTRFSWFNLLSLLNFTT
jgi:hypothetical protein